MPHLISSNYIVNSHSHVVHVPASFDACMSLEVDTPVIFGRDNSDKCMSLLSRKDLQQSAACTWHVLHYTI